MVEASKIAPEAHMHSMSPDALLLLSYDLGSLDTCTRLFSLPLLLSMALPNP